MPSFLGRLFGVSFRTERLIMNFIGLANSTLDWHSLKWTNKLEQIWSLSLSQRTLILETVGEERIKTVLSYVVIARILIAHVFTLSYIANFYPIITCSRPNLLLPWLVLSFFKNVVLEMIVIAVGLLFWYDKRFSLPIFLEFVLVKVVPLVFSTYNWYSNSRLYTELRHLEKARKLRRSLGSDTNLIAGRLYLKIAESKYRTRSVTTLISWESYDTNDTSDTISRIFDDPSLTSSQKVMRVLKLSDQDVEAARIRVKERERHRRLTEMEEEDFPSNRHDITRYFSIIDDYDLDMSAAAAKSVRGALEKDKVPDDDVPRWKKLMNVEATKEDGVNDPGLKNPSSSASCRPASPNMRIPDSSSTATKSSLQLRRNDSRSSVRTIKSKKSEETRDAIPKSVSAWRMGASLGLRGCTKKRGGPEPSEDTKKKQMKLQSPCSSTGIQPASTSWDHNNHPSRDGKDNGNAVDGNVASAGLKALFNCNCMASDAEDDKKMGRCCLSGGIAMTTSTPYNSPRRRRSGRSMGDDSVGRDDGVEGSKGGDDSRIAVEECLRKAVNEQARLDGDDAAKLIKRDEDRGKLLKRDIDKLKAFKEHVEKFEVIEGVDNLRLFKEYVDKVIDEAQRANVFMEDDKSETMEKGGVRDSRMFAEGVDGPELLDEGVDAVKSLNGDVDVVAEKLRRIKVDASTLLKKTIDAHKMLNEDAVDTLNRNVDALKLLKVALNKNADAQELLSEDVESGKSLREEIDGLELSKGGLRLDVDGEKLLNENSVEFDDRRTSSRKESDTPKYANEDAYTREFSKEYVEPLKLLRANVDARKFFNETVDALELSEGSVDRLNCLKESAQRRHSGLIMANTLGEEASREFDVEEVEILMTDIQQGSTAADLNNSSREVKESNTVNLKPLGTLAHENSAIELTVDNEIRNAVLVSTDCDMEKEYPLGAASVPRFYKDSMKVFEGCYEKDFANNSELQCLLRQLEKKKWNLYPTQVKHDLLLPRSFLTPSDRFTAQDLRTSYHLASDFDDMSRYELSTASCSKFSHDPSIPKAIQEKYPPENPAHRIVNQTVATRPVIEARQHANAIKNPASSSEVTPAENTAYAIVESKERTKTMPKRKRSKYEAVSSSSGVQSRKAEYQNAVGQSYTRLSQRLKSRKPPKAQRKPADVAKIVSGKSVCECETTAPASDDLFGPSEWKNENVHRRSEARYPVNSLRTVPLPLVAIPSAFHAWIQRRKPPAYPKKYHEIPPRTNSVETTSGRLVNVEKFPKATNWDPVRQPSNPKRFKWRGRVETPQEQEAREMRALKAYNEITLLEDKKDMEAGRKLPRHRKPLDIDPESARDPTQRRRNRSRIDPADCAAQVDEDYLGKENLLMDDTTETLAPVVAAVDRTFPRKFYSVSNEKYPCPKLSKVNRITGKLLENFDRLHRSQAARETGRGKRSVEVDTRKPYTKYSRPKKLTDEKTVSVMSVKKLEGAQRGRELERTQARRDVRDRLTMELPGTDPGTAEGYDREPSTSRHWDEGKKDSLLVMIKSTLMRDAIATWSTSTVDEEEQREDPETTMEAQLPSSPKFQPRTTENEFTLKLPADLPTVSSDQFLSDSIKQDVSIKQDEGDEPDESRHHLEAQEDQNPRDLSDSQEYGRTVRSLNSLEFTRTVDVIPTQNFVILSNPSSPKGMQLQRRNIVDDDSIRMLHQAFSDRSIDLILDLSEEILTVNDMLTTGRHMFTDEGFHLQPSREALGIPMEDLPPLPLDQRNFKRLLSTICRLREPEDPRYDLFGAFGSPVSLGEDSDEEFDEEFDDDEDVELIDANVLDINDIVARILNRFGLRGFNLEIISEEECDPREDLLEGVDEEEEEDEEYQTTDEAAIWERLRRFVREDICTDIRFPVLVRPIDAFQETDATEEVAEETDVNAPKIEPSKMNFFSMETEDEDEVVSCGIFWSSGRENAGRDGKWMHDEPSSSVRTNAMGFNVSSGSDPVHGASLAGYLNSLKMDEVISSGAPPSPGSSDSSRNLDATHKWARNIAEENGIDGCAEGKEDDSSEDVEEESARRVLRDAVDAVQRADDMEDDDIDEIVGEDGSVTFLGGEVEKMRSSEVDRSAGSEENDSIGGLEKTRGKKELDLRTAMEFRGTKRMDLGIEEEIATMKRTGSTTGEHIRRTGNFDLEDDEEIQGMSLDVGIEEEQKNTEARTDKDVTLKIILIFWFVVFYFYLRYFFEKIWTVRQISRATSALRPFEIHAVPTSTTTLLEKLGNEKQIVSAGNGSNGGGEDDEENDVLQEITDYEKVSTSKEQFFSVNSTLSTPKSFAQSFESPRGINSWKIENEVEETMLYLSEKVTENVTILPFFTSEESVPRTAEEEEVRSGSEPGDVDLETRSPFKAERSIGRQKELNSTYEAKRRDSGEYSSSFGVEKLELFRFSSPEKEIEDCSRLEGDGTSLGLLSGSDAEGTLLSNMESRSLGAEVKIENVDEISNVAGVHSSESEGESKEDIGKRVEKTKQVSDAEEIKRKETIENPDGIGYFIEDIKKDNMSIGQEEMMCSPEMSNRQMLSTDSFDSTYTTISKASKSTTSVADLCASSMEDFAISSDESNERT